MGQTNVAYADLRVVAAIDAAVHAAGGTDEDLADKIGVSRGLIGHWRCSRRQIDPHYCQRIEGVLGGAVTCDQLRPDLHWIRDNGTVVGYITPLDGNEPAYVAQCMRNETQRQPDWMPDAAKIRDDVGISDELGMLAAARRAFPTLRPEYQAYVAGMLHDWGEAGVAEVECQFRDTHAHEWDVTAVGLLFDAAERASNDRAYHFAYGMLYDFKDEARDALFDRLRVHDFQHWSASKNDALWEEAQRIRREQPEQLDHDRALVAQPASPATTPTSGPWLDIYKHQLRFDARQRNVDMVGSNVTWQVAQGATIDGALNDVSGFLTSAIDTLSNDNAVELNSIGWSAVHLLSLAAALVEGVHSTLLHLPRTGEQA